MARRSQFVCEGIDSKSPAPNMPDPDDIFSSGEIPWPDARPLNVYAFDPSIGKFVGNYMTALVRYEQLQAGPVGARFAVIDYDASARIAKDRRQVVQCATEPGGSARQGWQPANYSGPEGRAKSTGRPRATVWRCVRHEVGAA
jgi:hypothetical protein